MRDPPNGEPVAPLPAPLTTPRLHLRPIVDADVEAIVAMFGEPEWATSILRWQRNPVLQRWVHSQIANRTLRLDRPGWHWRIGRATDAQLLGCIDLYLVTPDEGRIGWHVGRAGAGQGLATEAVRAVVAHAFRDHGCQCVTARCFASNLASQRVLAKAGLVRESLGWWAGLRLALSYGHLRATQSWRLLRADWARDGT